MPRSEFLPLFLFDYIFRRNLLRQRVDYQGADQNLRTWAISRTTKRFLRFPSSASMNINKVGGSTKSSTRWKIFLSRDAVLHWIQLITPIGSYK